MRGFCHEQKLTSWSATAEEPDLPKILELLSTCTSASYVQKQHLELPGRHEMIKQKTSPAHSPVHLRGIFHRRKNW